MANHVFICYAREKVCYSSRGLGPKECCPRREPWDEEEEHLRRKLRRGARVNAFEMAARRARTKIMEITFDIPDELASRIRFLEDQLPKILELGLREFSATAQPGFEGVAAVVEALAALPSPEQVLALRPSETLQSRIEVLLEKNRTEGLSPAEEQEWAQYEYLEHIVRKAKAKAAAKLKTA